MWLKLTIDPDALGEEVKALITDEVTFLYAQAIAAEETATKIEYRLGPVRIFTEGYYRDPFLALLTYSKESKHGILYLEWEKQNAKGADAPDIEFLVGVQVVQGLPLPA